VLNPTMPLLGLLRLIDMLFNRVQLGAMQCSVV